MTKRFRDLLFIFFIFLFIVGTILISIYASGYKFNLSFPPDFNRILVKTGMLSLDSKPKGAKIFLNNKALPSGDWRPWQKKYKTTPSKLKNVLPGNYELTVEKEGYWPFKATVKVESGLTTFFEDINLFKSDNPSLKSVSDNLLDEENIYISSNNKYLFLKNSNTLIDLESDKEVVLESSENNDNSHHWLKNNTLLANGKIISPKNEKIIEDIRAVTGEDIYNLKFNNSEDSLYYQNDNKLSLLKIKNKISEPLISNTLIIDYLPDNNDIFILTEENSKVFIKKYSPDTLAFSESLELSKGGEFAFANSHKNNLVIYDKENKNLYLLDKNNLSKGYKSLDKVEDWAQSKDGLVYISDWELKYFDFKQSQGNLLARFSFDLENIEINEAKNYLILSGKKEVLVYDLKTGFNTNILEAEKISSPILDKANNFLYFWGKVADQQGVYRISIK